LLAVAKAPFRAAWLGDLAGAWIFYSVLPLPPGITPRFERIARFAPWVALAIGGLEAGLWQLLSPAGLIAQVALVLALGSWLSGGLHLDGVMDTADGLAAGPQRRLEAMDDSRVGASGVQALLQLLLVRIAGLALLAAAAPWALLWAAVWGRIAPLVAMQAFPYLREPAKGTAAFHRAHWKGLWLELLPSALVLAGLTALAGSPFAWLGWLGGIPALLVPLELGRRLGGHSGDSYGACVEWTVSWSLLLMGLISWRLAAAA
jgi:adenosylcobinamide-GDP ribazoletransferase